jgi:hypothetical protein
VTEAFEQLVRSILSLAGDIWLIKPVVLELWTHARLSSCVLLIEMIAQFCPSDPVRQAGEIHFSANLMMKNAKVRPLESEEPGFFTTGYLSWQP